MHNMLRIALIVLVLLPAGHAADTAIEKLRWMQGCWASLKGEPGSGEQWMAPAGGSMIGMSRMVRNGRTVAYEFLRIVEDEDGRVAYIASPSGQATTTFPLISVTDGEVVFENPGHDFPHRVVYRKLADGGLLGRIEGTVNGEDRHVDFPMRKADCAD
jgi:hypothetical protein